MLLRLQQVTPTSQAKPPQDGSLSPLHLCVESALCVVYVTISLTALGAPSGHHHLQLIPMSSALGIGLGTRMVLNKCLLNKWMYSGDNYVISEGHTPPG